LSRAADLHLFGTGGYQGQLQGRGVVLRFACCRRVLSGHAASLCLQGTSQLNTSSSFRRMPPPWLAPSRYTDAAAAASRAIVPAAPDAAGHGRLHKAGDTAGGEAQPAGPQRPAAPLLRAQPRAGLLAWVPGRRTADAVAIGHGGHAVRPFGGTTLAPLGDTEPVPPARLGRHSGQVGGWKEV
jgi:hypothetical protein